MATFINIDNTLINLDNVADVDTRDNHPEWDGSDWMRIYYPCQRQEVDELDYTFFNDTPNARRAYEWLQQACVATFTDASENESVERGEAEISARFACIPNVKSSWSIIDTHTDRYYGLLGLWYPTFEQAAKFATIEGAMDSIRRLENNERDPVREA